MQTALSGNCCEGGRGQLEGTQVRGVGAGVCTAHVLLKMERPQYTTGLRGSELQ